MDSLYGTSPENFVTARNAIVKSLRAEKRREEANEVAALRKPSRAVWALNQLALGGDPAFGQLVAAVGMARSATRDSFRDVIVVMRDALVAATAVAVGGMGHLRPEDHGQVEASLQKVVGDVDAFDALVAGRLREVPEGGIGALGAMPAGARGGEDPTMRSTKVARTRLPRATVPASRPVAPAPAAPADPASGAKAGRATKGASLERRRAEKDFARAVSAIRRAQEALDVAEAADADARAEVALAEAAVDEAERELEGARLTFNDALDEAQGTRAKVAAASAALEEAEAAQAMARATLDALS